MRIPVIPMAVVAVLMGGVVALFMLSPAPRQTLDAPEVNALLDIEGIETEVAVAPDGIRYAIIASGDLWFADTENATRLKLTDTAVAESSPAWTPDGDRITFTREADTFVIHPEAGKEALFLEGATNLAWSPAGQVAFVRDRGLWVAGATGQDARELVPANENPDVAVLGPRFAPEGNQILFILSMLDMHGEVWVADATSGDAIPIVADRSAENPTSAEWILDNQHIVYMTDRGGGLAVWFVDMEKATLLPMTAPMMGRSLAPLGIAVHGERIILPRHFIDSNIVTSDGAILVETENLEFDPAISPDGERIAYTVENEGRFEIWVALNDGRDATYLALGQHPRFSPSGNEVVYSRTDLDGNKDIWKADIRSGLPERLTDAAEIDDVPDWSRDGRSIIFSSERGGELALWSVPSSGGQRLRLNTGGYAPRFSPDGNRIMYWHRGGLWTAGADGSQPNQVAEVPDPVVGVWGPAGPAYGKQGRIHSTDVEELPINIWPSFDRLPDGNWLVSALEVQKTELWTLDLTFRDY